MPKISVYIHDRPLKYLNYVASVLSTSRSEVIGEFVKYIKEEVDEEKIFGKKEWEESLEEFESDGSKEEEEEESEDEKLFRRLGENE